MVNLLDQYSPTLQKKYYNNPNRRRLSPNSDNTMANLVEDRSYQASADPANNEVTLSNSFSSDNIASPNGNTGQTNSGSGASS